MALRALTRDQRNGVKVSLLAVMLVLFLFETILVAGSPIMYFGSQPQSVAYVFAVYIPVIAVCLLAYRRLGRS